jgi:cell division protein FtsL
VIRLNILLAALLVVCALGLVNSQHRARGLFVDLERVQGQARQLETQWNQLQLEQSALATSSLIDAKARKGLSMQPAPPQRTLYMNIDPSGEKTAMGAAR